MNSTSRTLLAALLAGSLAACSQPAAPPQSGSPTTPTTPSADGPPIGTYGGCLLLIRGADGLPMYISSLLGTVELRAGNTYAAPSFPGDGTYIFNASKSWVTFQSGPLNKVSAAFEHLDDGTPLLRFGVKLADPATDLEFGEAVCLGVMAS